MSRERIHPEGTDATYRVQESLKALVQLGGARKTFRLKPDANKALQQLVKLANANTETEAVEAAIIALRDQLRRATARFLAAMVEVHVPHGQRALATVFAQRGPRADARQRRVPADRADHVRRRAQPERARRSDIEAARVDVERRVLAAWIAGKS